MTGLAAHPDSTLVERALTLLGEAPVDSAVITRDVLGIPTAGPAVADRLATALLGADPRVQRRLDGCWHLVTDTADERPLASCPFAVVDLETTGARAGRGDRVTELAVVWVQGGRVEVVVDRLVNPERPIPPVVTRVTRITNAMVRDQPVFAEVAPEVVNALEGRVFVAHNVTFDWRFLDAELRRARGLRLDGPRVCTVDLSRRLLPHLPSRGLDGVTDWFGIPIAARHRAGGDALATAHVLVRLLDLAAEQGAHTLADLRTIGRRPRRRGRRRPAGPTWMEQA